MTSCGCFECICGIEPFSNGVVIANREYAGMTPLGMTFSEMASMTGGGVQTPGFMGHGKHFISSKKFMKAEGGIERIVWMPKELKETVRELRDQGVTVLISTHMLEMVEDLWDVMFVMEKGKIIGSYRKSEAGEKDLDDLFFEMTGGDEK